MHYWIIWFNAVSVFAGLVCIPVLCIVRWSVSMLSLCLQDQYVFLYHALLDGLFQCCHCVCRTSMWSCTMLCWMVCFNVVTVFAGPVCVPVPSTVWWSVSMLALCLPDQYVFLCQALFDGLFQCWHCVSGPVCVPDHVLLDSLFQCCHCVCRTNIWSCTMQCWMVCFSDVTVFTGPVYVPVPCTVRWSVSVLSLCLQDK